MELDNAICKLSLQLPCIVTPNEGIQQYCSALYCITLDRQLNCHSYAGLIFIPQ